MACGTISGSPSDTARPLLSLLGITTAEETTMSQQHPESDATDLVPAEMADLAIAIQQLPEVHRRHLDPIMATVLDGIRRRRQILGLVQDALSQLRLDMKYLIFDLEATRRERDEYRRQLEETGLQ
jgi:hypothetical protein